MTRETDAATRAVVAAASSELAVSAANVSEPGQVAALNAGVGDARADIVAITDDDAEPLPDWVERIVAHFSDASVAGVGGRDRVVGSDRPPLDVVGRVRWYGKTIGNHHRGRGEPRDVDILKGANMAFRASWVRRFGFDERLRGPGAQVHNDLLLSLRVRRAGGRLIYDPEVVVDHHVAVRPAGDDRSARKVSAVRDELHNEALALFEFLSPARRLAYVVWSTLVGTRHNPGLAIGFLLLPTQGSWALKTAFHAATGRALGVRTWLASRR